MRRAARPAATTTLSWSESAITKPTGLIAVPTTAQTWSRSSRLIRTSTAGPAYRVTRKQRGQAAGDVGQLRGIVQGQQPQGLAEQALVDGRELWARWEAGALRI